MDKKTLTGILLDEQSELSMQELCRVCRTSSDWVIELVEEGVIEPQGREPARWRFSGSCIARARTARRLQRDLDLNLAGVALALDLLDEIGTLRDRLYQLEITEGRWP